MNQLQRLKTLFLVLIIAAPTISRANAETPDVMALATLDRFMIAFNDQDIKVGSHADLTLFNPDKSYDFSIDHILSTSKNCAFIGSKLKGVVYGSINNRNSTLNKLWT